MPLSSPIFALSRLTRVFLLITCPFLVFDNLSGAWNTYSFMQRPDRATFYELSPESDKPAIVMGILQGVAWFATFILAVLYRIWRPRTCWALATVVLVAIALELADIVATRTGYSILSWHDFLVSLYRNIDRFTLQLAIHAPLATLIWIIARNAPAASLELSSIPPAPPPVTLPANPHAPQTLNYAPPSVTPASSRILRSLAIPFLLVGMLLLFDSGQELYRHLMLLANPEKPSPYLFFRRVSRDVVWHWTFLSSLRTAEAAALVLGAMLTLLGRRLGLWLFLLAALAYTGHQTYDSFEPFFSPRRGIFGQPPDESQWLRLLTDRERLIDAMRLALLPVSLFILLFSRYKPVVSANRPRKNPSF